MILIFPVIGLLKREQKPHPQPVVPAVPDVPASNPTTTNPYTVSPVSSTSSKTGRCSVYYPGGTSHLASDRAMYLCVNFLYFLYSRDQPSPENHQTTRRTRRTCHPLTQFRKKPEVRFQKPLSLLQLTATRLGIAHPKSRHKLGLSRPALLHQENSLAFFSLLAIFPLDHPTHNRQVEGSSPSGPTIFHNFQRLITA
jgi:hypothetical protein